MPNLNNEGFAIAPAGGVRRRQQAGLLVRRQQHRHARAARGHAELHRPDQAADDHVRSACGDHVRQRPRGARRVLHERAAGQLHGVRPVHGERHRGRTDADGDRCRRVHGDGEPARQRELRAGARRRAGRRRSAGRRRACTQTPGVVAWRSLRTRPVTYTAVLTSQVTGQPIAGQTIAFSVSNAPTAPRRLLRCDRRRRAGPRAAPPR